MKIASLLEQITYQENNKPTVTVLLKTNHSKEVRIVMKPGQFRPVQTLLQMMRRMVSKIACHEIKYGIQIVVGSFIVVFSLIQTGMMVVGCPGGYQHSGNHWQHKQDHCLHRLVDD